MTFSEEPTVTTPESTCTPRKLIDKIANYRKEHGKPFFSLEFFPPRNLNETATFWPLMDKLRDGNPLFMDITWHSRTTLDPDDCLSSLGAAHSTIKRFNHDTVLHLTCTQYDETTMESILDSAKALGIKNILALRGDPQPQEQTKDDGDNVKKDPINNVIKDDRENDLSNNSNQSPVTEIKLTEIQSLPPEQSTAPTSEVNLPVENGPKVLKGFTCALDLIKFIRTKFADYFCLGVAGYPMGHPDAKSYDDDLKYLKAKVDAGSDFIVTQLSFSADQYITFIKDCRTIGIKVPIIPGIFPVQTKVSIRNISKLTQVEPPEEVKKAFDALDGNLEAIKQFGISHCVDLCKKLINSGLEIHGFHFYTLNRDNCVSEILKQLNLWNQISLEPTTLEPTIEPQTDNTSVPIQNNTIPESNVTLESVSCN